jgi:hypothetical protein
MMNKEKRNGFEETLGSVDGDGIGADGIRRSVRTAADDHHDHAEPERHAAAADHDDDRQLGHSVAEHHHHDHVARPVEPEQHKQPDHDAVRSEQHHNHNKQSVFADELEHHNHNHFAAAITGLRRLTVRLAALPTLVAR